MTEVTVAFQSGTTATGGAITSLVSGANPLPVAASTTIAPGSTFEVQGLGTAGAATGGVLSVQGEAGMTPVITSGTVVVSGGTIVVSGGTVAVSGGTVSVGNTPAVTGTVGISQTTPGTTNAIVFQATSASTAGITAVTTLTTLESGHVAKAGAGNLYDCYVTNTGTAAGYLFVMNSTTVPANGTLGSGVIVECIAVGTIASGGISYNGGPPTVFSTGISLAFSSTAAPVLTLAATGFFNARVA